MAETQSVQPGISRSSSPARSVPVLAKTVVTRTDTESSVIFHDSRPVNKMATGDLGLDKEQSGDHLKSLISKWFHLPTGFFESRAEFRTWGKRNVCDPAVQPRPCSLDSTVAYPFTNPLPGYPDECYLNFISSIKNREHYCSVAGTETTNYKIGSNFETPLIHMDYPLNKNFRPQPVGYNWTDLCNYKLDTHPYVNAFMTAQNPLSMYGPANQFVAYPYGVPAVEENERSDVKQINKSRWGCC